MLSFMSVVYAGIDEAGYGPMLGPLCVGCVALRVHDPDEAIEPPNLWRRLAPVVCRARGKKASRIAVDDSKRLKGSNAASTVHPLHRLERGVMAFHGQIHDLPTIDQEAFDTWGVRVPDHAWYRSTTAVPLARTRDETRIDAARLRRRLSGAGIEHLNHACRAIDADEFNRSLRVLRSKAAINFDAILRLIDETWRRFAGEEVRIGVDRQSGRRFYREPLQQAWPEASIAILVEDDRTSRYRLEHPSRGVLTLEFEVDADAKRFPVALASMTAKLTRELFMLRMNRYFGSLREELKPTAGYFGDARRYLDELRPVIESRAIDRAVLVRAR